MTGYPQVMLAVGKPRPLLRFNLGMLVFYAGVVLVAAPHGLTTVCLTVVGAHLVILVGVYRLLLWPYVGVPMRRLVTDVLPALGGCLALLGVGFAVRDALGGAPAPVLLAAIGVVGAAAYLARHPLPLPGGVGRRRDDHAQDPAGAPPRARPPSPPSCRWASLAVCGIVGQARADGPGRAGRCWSDVRGARAPRPRQARHLRDDGAGARHPAAARDRPRDRRPADLQRGRHRRRRPQRRDLQLPRAARASSSGRGHRFAHRRATPR